MSKLPGKLLLSMQLLRRATALLLIVSVTAVLGACQSVSYSDSELIEAALKAKPQSLETYVLGPGDAVSVSVWRNPDLSTETTIRPDGKLSSPLVGDLLAAGLSPEQLATAIEDRLSVYLKEPKVSVIVRNSNSYEFTNRVRITGAVNNPQSIPYKEGVTILDLVLSAGGMTDFAKGGSAILYRQFQQQTVVIPVDLEAIMNGGDIRANYRLLPGDVVTVPEKVL
ncbi:XrtA/PEP-CTERM system exopolysaccharide export protein [Allohahella sp. A8]|uniref:XrtA/PEP-CTERM system exopolysaccharide export protein n=1 Tax=Allohahella sp. A8 TaxID=3141461 RepID=UPI0026CF4FBA|tara:strand:+ start:33985 stop:34659 length:675 start_codon:yes stop_codon:yes gene_type:complete